MAIVECVYLYHVITTVVTAGLILQLTLFICVHVEMKFHGTFLDSDLMCPECVYTQQYIAVHTQTVLLRY